MPDCITELSMVLDEDENVTKLAVEALIRFGAIERWENDTFYMTALQNLIGSETQGAERVRRHRALKAEQKALQCNGGVTACNIEIDKEKDIDIYREKKEERIDYKAIIDCYNDTCVSLQKVKALSDSRKKAIKARLNTYSFEDIKTVFEKAEASDFLKGKNDRNWQANFDWLMKDSNFAKVLDGNYDNKPKNGGKNNASDSEFSGFDFSQFRV